MAHGFALLRLPKMPELRGKSFPSFIETTVDTDTIRYKDKNREKQRRKMLAELKEKDKTPFPKKNFIQNKSWSKQKTKKERRKKRVAKRKHNEVFLLNIMTKLSASLVWIHERLSSYLLFKYRVLTWMTKT